VICIYHIKNVDISQEPPALAVALSDKGRNGRERPWRAYKMANELLSIAYESINRRKSERLKACGKVLTFTVDRQTGQKVLTNAESCRVRLCPLCSWRRSLKNFWNTIKIVKYLKSYENRQEVGKYSYIFITLTVKNCRGEDLSATIDDLFSAVKRLYERKEIKKAFRGMVRNLEITHNVNPNSKDYDTFHPHFHMIAAVRPSYFTSRDYISQERLKALWKECLRVEYDPLVDVRRVKSRSGTGSDPDDCGVAQAVAECSKYAAKAADYIIPDDWDLTVETVRVLDAALDRRRLINYSGVFREVKQLLCLEDADDGDLVKVGEDMPKLGEDTYTETYWWYSGYRQYYRIEK
jgi:plasmid rolling circle replication initiator protein Rep